MRLRPFELVAPESLPEALDVLARADGDARVVAGGTALVPMMRLGLVRAGRVVSLHRVAGLGEIREESSALHLGAMVSMAHVQRSPIVRAGWPLLAEAAGRVATPAIRSSATIGGNLGYAEPASDPAPALLCLDAEVRIATATGERSLPLARFLTGYYETALGPGEIVAGARIPTAPAGALTGYVKFCPRSAEDKPLIGVAALLVRDPATGRCRDVRIGLAGAAPTAIRATGAEARLRHAPLDDGAIHEAAEAAAAEADPLTDLMGSADYRRRMVRVWVSRLLVRLRDAARAS